MVGFDGELQIGIRPILIQSPDVVGKDGGVGGKIFFVMLDDSVDVNIRYKRKYQ
jgi:hypothetical protein